MAEPGGKIMKPKFYVSQESHYLASNVFNFYSLLFLYYYDDPHNW